MAEEEAAEVGCGAAAEAGGGGGGVRCRGPRPNREEAAGRSGRVGEECAKEKERLGLRLDFAALRTLRGIGLGLLQ